MRIRLFLAAMLVAASSLATDYYASPSGSGTTCSIGSPCTFAYLLRNKAVAGDTVWLRGGTYTTSGNSPTTRWWYNLSGTAANPITYRNYNNEHALMDCNFDNTGTLNNFCLGVSSSTPMNSLIFWGLDFDNSSTTTRITPADLPSPVGMNEVTIAAIGGKLINNFFRNQRGGTTDSTISGTTYGKTIYGNYFQYMGWVGQTRGFGHSMYLENPQSFGETGRTYVQENFALRAFDYGTQIYGSQEPISYITFTGNTEAAAGHQSKLAGWSATGTQNNYYLGTSGGVSNSCLASDKVWYKGVFDSNFSYGSNGTTVGGSKGVCDIQITNNYFATAGGFAFTKDTTASGCSVAAPCGLYAPITITGNFFNNTACSGGCIDPPVGLTFNQVNYPTNTWGGAAPGKTQYHINAYEAGRGYVVIHNPALTANVTVNPTLMGCYTGEPIRIFNGQSNNPWTSTPIATQTGCAAISLPTTCTGACVITAPGFTTDGSTPFPTPADLGPEFVAYFMYPDWGTAVTPTPTSSNTPTRTNTSTPTLTPTRTNTSTNTPTGTITPTNTFTNTPTLTVTPTPSNTRTPTMTRTPGGNTTLFTVSNCVAVAPMTITADPTANGGYYASSSVSGATTPSLGGTLTCAFSLPASGLWRLWAQINTPSATADSMYLVYDAEVPVGGGSPDHVFDMGNVLDCDQQGGQTLWGLGWIYNIGNDRENNCVGSTTVPGPERGVAPNPGVSLAAGAHTFTLYGREVGAQVSSFLFTQNFNYDPNNPVVTPTPVPTPSGLCKRAFKCKGRILYQYQPCSIPPKNPCPHGS